MKRLWTILIMAVLLIGGYLIYRQVAGGTAAAADASLIPLLTEEETAGFARATEPGAIQFPEDLGAHPDYQTEWWYYTGNLETENGRQFGYQFTIFRRALSPGDQYSVNSNQSDWRTNQVYLAHFTISDVANEAFYPHERFSRGAAGLAGAQARPYRVWLQDWVAEEVAPGQVRIFADTEDVTLDVTLTQTLPPILHGDEGLSAKGPQPGNASYYYSFVQQRTEGTVRIGDETFAVSGKSWKDHEYSTSALSDGAIGWDWFSIQLDNGASLMFFEIRNEDGSLEPFSSGSFIDAAGNVTPLQLGDWELEVTDRWTSPESGATYPAGWRIRVPQFGIALTGDPLMPNQELRVSTVYWEGAVGYSGTMNGAPVTGQGYVEMTGYFETMRGRL